MNGSFISGISRNVSVMTSASVSYIPRCPGFTFKSIIPLGNRSLSMSNFRMSDKSKLLRNWSEANGVIEHTRHGLDVGERSQQKLEQFNQNENHSYENYQAGIVKTSESSSNSVIGKIQQLMTAENKVTGYNNVNKISVRTMNLIGMISAKSSSGWVLMNPPQFPMSRDYGSCNMVGGVRPVTQYSMMKGKKKTVHHVINRFFRLHWGAWIRPKSGRHRKVWRKNNAMRKRALQHVFCNPKQSHMLDKMVCRFWREKKYYVDDPYESYHVRDNFLATRRWP